MCEKAQYKGLLPFGAYTYGGKDFQSVKGMDYVDVYLEPTERRKRSGGQETRRRRDGLRMSMGPAFTQVGASSEGSLQATEFAGMGVRGGAGWEIEIARSVGVAVEAGYQGILIGQANASSTDVFPVTDTYRDGLNLFYLWAPGTYWFGNFGVAAGPSWAGGTARTKGITDGCTSGSGEGCDQVGALSAESLEQVAVRGTVLTGGGAVSFYWGFIDVGFVKNGRGGLSLNVGAQTDSARLYPWGQIAFTIAPAG